MYTGLVPALSRKHKGTQDSRTFLSRTFLQTLLSPSLDSLMLLSKRWTHGRYWLDYIGLVGLLTLVSQTLLSRTRWSLRRYCPKHRSTEAAVRLIGLTVAAHEFRIRQRTVTHIGPLTLLSRTPNSQLLGYERRFCTRSSHAHKTRNVSFTFAGLPNVALTTTGLSDALSHVHSHTLLFTNTGLANAPLMNGELANALSRTRVTKTVP